MTGLIPKLRTLLDARSFLYIPFAIALLFSLPVFGTVLPGLAILVLLLAVTLFVSKSILPACYTFFAMICLGILLFPNFSPVLEYWYVSLPAAAGVILHPILYRKEFHPGISFRGILACSAAVLLGGLGTIAVKEYFHPVSLFYVFSLSGGLVIAYFFFSSECAGDLKGQIGERYLWMMLLCGVVNSGILLFRCLQTFIVDGGVLYSANYLHRIPFRNTVATFLNMALPTPFFFALSAEKPWKKSLFFLLGGVFYFSLVLSAARTALLFGTVHMLLCIAYYFWKEKEKSIRRLHGIALAVLVITIMIFLKEAFFRVLLTKLDGGMVEANEERFILMFRSGKDFLSNPLFGIGLGSMKNADIYWAEGCICWYHMYIPQVIGSMGLVGIVTFGYALFLRGRLALHHMDRCGLAISMTYLGLFLCSQTDPGEFAPVPFAILAVMAFAILENRREHRLQTCFLKRKPAK